MQDENATLRERCRKLEQRLVAFKSSTNNLEQYGRRNNIVINHLEESVSEILSDIDVKVTSNDIDACHRIGKKNNRIIRFVNRKHAKKAFFNKKEISQNYKNYSFNTNNNLLFISENLKRMNESLAYQGRKLKACVRYFLSNFYFFSKR